MGRYSVDDNRLGTPELKDKDFLCVMMLTKNHIYNIVSKARPWHDARAIAHARTITCTNEEKGSLGG